MRIDYRVPRPDSCRDIVSAVLDVIWDKANFYDGRDLFLESTAPATRGLLAAWACRWYYREVCNGGHGQFFSNSTGMVWEEALVGFRLFDCPKYFDVLEEAVQLFGIEGPSFDREVRNAQHDLLPDNCFESLDNRIYELDEFDGKIELYIRDHPSEFFFDA